MLVAIAGSLTAVLATAALYGWGRDRVREWSARRAELAAYAAQVAGSDPASWVRADQRERERLAARERALSLAWRANIDEQIAEMNAKFDALQGRSRSAFTMLLDRVVTGGGAEGRLIELARTAPRVVLREVRRANALPTAFSWHTGEYPVVARHPATVRVPRRRATLQRALDVTHSPILTL